MYKYYPWKSPVLKSWLESIINEGKSLGELATDLQISQDALWGWLVLFSQAITLEQVQLIARYRNQSFDSTAQWLGICSAHLDAMILPGEPSARSSNLLLSSSSASRMQ